MSEVTTRELRNHVGRVLDRVMMGESIVVTREGKPLAELRPIQRDTLDARTLLERWRHLPQVEPVRLRAGRDALFDPTLSTHEVPPANGR
jgi:prevent-host-death family protein